MDGEVHRFGAFIDATGQDTLSATDLPFPTLVAQGGVLKSATPKAVAILHSDRDPDIVRTGGIDVDEFYRPRLGLMSEGRLYCAAIAFLPTRAVRAGHYQCPRHWRNGWTRDPERPCHRTAAAVSDLGINRITDTACQTLRPVFGRTSAWFLSIDKGGRAVCLCRFCFHRFFPETQNQPLCGETRWYPAFRPEPPHRPLAILTGEFLGQQHSGKRGIGPLAAQSCSGHLLKWPRGQKPVPADGRIHQRNIRALGNMQIGFGQNRHISDRNRPAARITVSAAVGG